MDAYIIIGRQRVGKSSVIRALTGLRGAGQRLMMPLSGPNFQLWTENMSLQETPIAPAAFISKIAAKPVQAVLIALWPRECNSRGITYPDHNAYIAAFTGAGWTIKHIVHLYSGTSAPPIGVSSPFTSLTSSPALPFNKLAADIRLLWHWY